MLRLVLLVNTIHMEDTRTMKELCVEVLAIQDACNATAVTGSMNRAMRRMLRMGMDGDAVNQHPITCLYIDKLCHLAQLAQPIITASYDNVHRMANAEQP